MGRSRRRARAVPHVPLRSASFTRAESGADGEWLVRSVSASSSTKDYRCPGCDQLIPSGTAHLVVWPAGEYGSVADRRHWHASCWAARLRRRPGRRR
jgi:hypothetical protein